MPIHDLGYRGWTGKRSSENLRWFVIAETGIRLAWQSRWVRRLMIASWIPCIVFGAAIFFFEQSMRQPPLVQRGAQELQKMRQEIQRSQQERNPANSRPGRGRGASGRSNFPLAGLFSGSELLTEVDPQKEPEKYRHNFWSMLLFNLFRYSQGYLIVLMVGLIAPPLISKDFRSRAFLVYFARPLSVFEYVLGKSLVIATYVFLISAFPAIFLLIFGAFLAPSLDVLLSTWDIFFRILLSLVVLVVPTTVIALCLSSMCEDSRYAGFAWFAAWILGAVTYAILTVFAFQSQTAQRNAAILFDDSNLLALVSPYHMMGAIQSWIFGMDPKISFTNILPHVSVLAAITVCAAYIMLRRVSKPMNV